MISYLREGFIPVFISTSKKSKSLIERICKGCCVWVWGLGFWSFEVLFDSWRSWCCFLIVGVLKSLWPTDLLYTRVKRPPKMK